MHLHKNVRKIELLPSTVKYSQQTRIYQQVFCSKTLDFSKIGDFKWSFFFFLVLFLLQIYLEVYNSIWESQK